MCYWDECLSFISSDIFQPFSCTFLIHHCNSIRKGFFVNVFSSLKFNFVQRLKLSMLLRSEKSVRELKRANQKVKRPTSQSKVLSRKKSRMSSSGWLFLFSVKIMPKKHPVAWYVTPRSCGKDTLSRFPFRYWKFGGLPKKHPVCCFAPPCGGKGHI